MATASLRSIELLSFKSFSNATLPLDSMTVLTGRNSSGKSNALDAAEVLSRLASGEDLYDALDGRRREGGPVRGGSRGCAPHGQQSFALGCTVGLGNREYTLRVKVQVQPEPRIVEERLWGPAPALESGVVEERALLWTRAPSSNSPGLDAEIYNGKRGMNPASSFRDNRLLTTQLTSRINPKNRADRAVLQAAEAVTSALRGIFHLDPVPHLMRGYVSERDTDLRRTGENVSAAVSRLMRDDPEAFERILHAIDEVADQPIEGIAVEASPLGDLMLALRERAGGRTDITPAREMSDGLLRFLAIATALLTSDRGLDIDPGLSTRSLQTGVLLVVEEIENGLHPSQAGRLLELIREAASTQATKVLITTHSPALLNALTGSLNQSVVVCYRDPENGNSKLTRLTELPGYAEALAGGELGDAVSRGDLVHPRTATRDLSDFNRLLGLS
jgi:predicted ATPase